ncbi:AAA family ATPase [Streptomyces sp. NBC_01571]|uniref:UvrD-helicase domain-containing protein n=1 Tax=Streptomyces sp. NBC_01571 TaxID=2975883 RepID=UPI00224E58B8|nr:UvrD-helicase domain-containing protein [Streptomyces sp. NBC_01571]MCX4579059.1 AAA family ATPase [Streptomyces sp. NBC_01571]
MTTPIKNLTHTPSQSVVNVFASEAQAVQEAILSTLHDGRHFKVEAGAGAGKTSSLIEAVQGIIAHRHRYLPRRDQRVACITYTNVARDEIISRTDSSPYVYADTIHGFLWRLLSPFPRHLLRHLVELDAVKPKLEGRTSLDGYTVGYTTGFAKIDHETLHVQLAHNDLPALACKLFTLPKFRAIVADQFPVVFVDEYQDTPAGLAEALLGTPDEETRFRGPLCGFFGDHWQQIYDNVCGTITDPRLKPIIRRRNRRSERAVVDFLNSMRPELKQTANPRADQGSVTIYHTNDWAGTRLTHHQKGQIGWDAAHAARSWVLQDARTHHWRAEESVGIAAAQTVAPNTKILMLTHETIAGELGYQRLHKAFRRNESYVKKEDHIMAFFLDVLEPALLHHRNKRYGAMFDILGHRSLLTSPADKRTWAAVLHEIDETRETGTVGDVLDLCLKQRLFDGLSKIRERQQKSETPTDDGAQAAGDDKAKARAKEYQALRAVPYAQLLALHDHLGGGTPFATQHGVKGQEFDRVLTVISKGHTRFQIPEMLASYSRRHELTGKDQEAFVRARNLFYVACSRAKQHLALLFTARLDPAALDTLCAWVGSSRIHSLQFDGDSVMGGAPEASSAV